jgi:hypothetical protein
MRRHEPAGSASKANANALINKSTFFSGINLPM